MIVGRFCGEIGGERKPKVMTGRWMLGLREDIEMGGGKGIDAFRCIKNFGIGRLGMGVR